MFLRPGPFHDQRVRIIEQREPFFARHGPKAGFLGRWVTGLRIAFIVWRRREHARQYGPRP